MHNRREMLSHSAKVAAMLAAAGLLPGLAFAQAPGYNAAAFAAKNTAEVMKALGSTMPSESKDVTVTGVVTEKDGKKMVKASKVDVK